MLKRVFHNAVSILIDRWRYVPKLPAGVSGFAGDVPVLSTGFSKLDRATGIKGLPQGKITELVGSDFRGVFSIAAGIAAKFQRRQLAVTVIDLAGSFDRALALRCGLVAPELVFFTPANAFELIGLLEQAAGEPGLVVVNLGFTPLTLAGANSASLRLLLRRLRQIGQRAKCVSLYITVPGDADPLIHTNYPNGFPLNEAADIRLWVQDQGWIKRNQQISGYKGNITVIKNRLAPDGKGADLRIPFVDPQMDKLADEFGF